MELEMELGGWLSHETAEIAEGIHDLKTGGESGRL
jgi:hypothetical protein